MDIKQISLPCDIVLLPASDLAQKALAISRELQQYGGLFSLNDNGPFPHASLYMTQLNEADLDKVKALLADIAAKTPVQHLIATGYYQEERYIDPNYDRTPDLARLQMTVIDAVNPIREGLRSKDQARLATTTGIAHDNLEKYGYRGVGELFRPHITLTRFADEITLDVSLLPPASTFSGDFVALGLFEMGDNGTCIREIARFELRGDA
ncbi:MAG TPA: DUF1045 domain-containing protein [Candidatus Saccharimonadales bacterium]